MFRNILTFLILSLISSNLHAVSPDQPKPKLIVGIVVDQMRSDYLTRYWNKYGDDGFKKLAREGYNCANTHFNYNVTFTSPGHASIYTGTTPSVHGIIGNDWYNRELKQMVYVTWDPETKGTGSDSYNGTMSPANLMVTTFGDELRLASNLRSKVISVSLKDRGAILPGGRTANEVYWSDNATGNWISSNWYMNTLPEWVVKFNSEKRADAILHTVWNPLLPISEYTESTADNMEFEYLQPGETQPVFPHRFDNTADLNYELLRNSPFSNTMTKDFALQAMRESQLGKDEFTDLLAISFSATDYIGHDYGTHSIETEDAFIRLDLDLADLIKQVEDYAGKQNVVFFLTSDHGVVPISKFLTDHKVASALFSARQLNDSLNNYLYSVYGTKQWISKIYKNQVYLDQQLLTENKIPEREIKEKIADFLRNYKGVDQVLINEDLFTNDYTTGMRHLMQNGFYRRRSGDVIFTTDPGLLVYGPRGTDHGSGYTYDTQVPLIFYGKDIPKGSTSRQVHITDIAPTITQMLGIQSPNGSTGKVIEEVIK